MFFRDKSKHQPDRSSGGSSPESQSADEYLSKLASSILSKDKGPQRSVAPAPSAPQPVRPRTSSASSEQVRLPSVSVPVAQSDSNDEVPLPIGAAKDWIRQVDFYDAQGKFIPGTILLFEDGAVGVFKESNASKDYDIIYMLRKTGRIAAQGMPLYNYEIEPIGRLSYSCFDNMQKSDRWERDMMVFHLLKYKDHIHIPHIDEDQNINSRQSGETFSQWAVQKLPLDQLDSPAKQDKPQLSRGRRMTIEFGPGQKWEAVYWGKDELGYVVAHNTHDRWALMHLDLDKFKESTTFHDIVEANTLRKMERDFAP